MAIKGSSIDCSRSLSHVFSARFPVTEEKTEMPKKAQLVLEERSTYDSSLQKKTNVLASKNLTKLQSQVLEKFVYYSRDAHFLSSHDLGRLMPHATHKIEHSVTHLRNLGFIKTADVDGPVHYCPSEELKYLRKKMPGIAIFDKIESEIIRIVRASLQQLYPDALTTERGGATGLFESKRFDIILEFKKPVMSKQFVIVDVYAKIPITKSIVQSFVRKIRWTQNETELSGDKAENACYPLRGKTLGMIVCNNASQEAVDVAREHDISLLWFRDIHIDYNRIRKNSHTNTQRQLKDAKSTDLMLR
jgi:hypothetical protein